MRHSSSPPPAPQRAARLKPAGQRAGEGSRSAAAYIQSDNIVKLVRVERGAHPQRCDSDDPAQLYPSR